MESLYITNTSGKFLFIRHGQSEFNKYGKEKSKLNPDMIGCGLSESGIKQIEESSKLIKNLKFKDIYVSPLRRTLETAYILLKEHPQKDDIILKVNPLCQEIVAWTCDWNFDINELQKKYNMNSEIKYDWSIFNNIYKDPIIRETYYFDYICEDNKKLVQNILDNITEKWRQYFLLSDNNNKEHIKNDIKLLIIDAIKICANYKYGRAENFKHIYERCVQYKKYLYDIYNNDINNSDDKVLTVTHQVFIKFCTSKIAQNDYDFKEYPSDCYMTNNGEIISININ